MSARAAATDPILGDWKFNTSRSTPDTMTVTSAGGNKYTFDFGGGPETIVVDGTDQPSGVYGGNTLSVAVEAGTWKVVRKAGGRAMLSAIWSLSKDGDTLTDRYTGFAPDGKGYTQVYTYERKAPGSGFAGRWVSKSQEPVNFVLGLQIRPFGENGISIVDSSSQIMGNLDFAASQVRRTDDRTLDLMRKKGVGEPSVLLHLELSADHKALIITPHSPSGAALNTFAFDRIPQAQGASGSRVGFAVVSMSDPADKPIELAIWYPTSAEPASMDLGLARQLVARDAPIAGRDLPLIVISHGNGGGWPSHADTAVALAAAGFVVAAPSHTGDNFRDESYVGTDRWFTERARHVRRVIDYMREEWRGRDRLDGRVGIFGFSAGAFTALVAVGGVPDMSRVSRHCREAPEVACTLWKEPPTSVAASSWVHDRRISAAVIAAPGLGFAFDPDGLGHLTAAVQVWAAGDDRVVPYASNTAIVRR